MNHRINAALLAATLLISGTSCSDFLKEDMQRYTGPDKSYTNTHGFDVAATGIYAYARDEFNTWGGTTGEYAFSHGQACPYEMFQVATDIVHQGKATNDGSLSPFENLSYTPTTTFVVSYWRWGYGLIAQCNLLLEYSEKDNVKWDQPTDKEYYQAVARFFRAYAYRYLVYLYGDVPYVDKVEQDGYRLDFTRTPQAEVLGHIIDDLTFAADKLPEDPEKAGDGKLTKWAALHLLSEMYIMAGKYEEAEKAADAVINSKYYKLMDTRFGAKKNEPGDPFYDMFTENNQNRKSGNDESIFVFQLEYNTSGGGGTNEDWTRRAWNPRYWDDKNFTLADTLGGRGLAQIVPLQWWIGHDDTSTFYDAGDIRNSEFNIKRHWYYNQPDSTSTFGKLAPITDATWAANTRYPVITKFFYGRNEDLTYTGNNKDRIKFRLAETYLLKAEACIRDNKPDEAAKAINEVRKRAHATEITASQATMDFLLDERIRELVGEELRRFTLRRNSEYWLPRVKKYNEYVKGMDEHHFLLPVPKNIIDSNTGAKFPQNPGYE
ncbi:MAG: RagB/SusD family nutrient uptake outer membrane protein [Mediterranea sp.]|jgi:hypothetical protein|nr:RagB/SusD family nutrient uptake outer membrane protein [Mediterranea sp.]